MADAPYTQVSSPSPAFTRVVQIISQSGATISVLDDHAARALLRKRKAIPVWGKRQIIALKLISSRDYDSPAWKHEEDPPYLYSERWPSIFTQSARPGILDIRSIFEGLTIQQTLKPSPILVISKRTSPKRKQPVSSGLRLAA